MPFSWRLPDCFVADGAHQSQFHDMSGQQPQRPVRVALWWRAETRRNQPCLLLAVKQLGNRRGTALLAAKREIETLQDRPFAHVLDRLDPTMEGLGDLSVRPARSVGVDLQQDPSAPRLLAAALEASDCVFADAAFLVREPDNVLLNEPFS